MHARFMLPLLLLSAAMAGAPAESLGDVAFRQAQLDLGTDFRLLCLAAHPDDEDGATLSLYRKKYGVKTFALIATRGEGGQNEIGPELYAELGVIRTKEMQAAAAIEGAELHFLDLPEFGFSKTPEETLAIWGEENTLRRLVAKLRELRPHVVITHHGRMQDHGHHQAIGHTMLNAFEAAADPAVFPDLHSPWQVQRLYIRNWAGDGADVEIPISELESHRGKTYAEIAADALRVHESQGMGFFIDRLLTDRPKAFYDLVKSVPVGVDQAQQLDDSLGPLFAGLPLIDHSNDGDAPEDLATRKQSAGWLLSRNDAAPSALKPALLAYLGGAGRTHHSPQHDEALHRLAAAATELDLAVRVSDTAVVPGQNLALEVEVTDYGTRDAGSVKLWAHAFNTAVDVAHPVLDADGVARHRFEITVPDVPVTVPNAEYLFAPEFLAPQLHVYAEVECGDDTIALSSRHYVDVAPAAEISLPDGPWLHILGAEKPLSIDVLVSNRLPGDAAITVVPHLPEGWGSAPESIDVAFAREDEQRLARFRISPPEGIGEGRVDFEISAGSSGHPDFSRSARIESVPVVVPPGLHVGVVQSYDDTFVRTLERLDVPHRALTQDDFNRESLRAYTAIILDIRAYLERPDLVSQNEVFLQYVHEGGTLLVMYNKTFEWQPHFAPYPLNLSRNRVTVEDAPLRLLEPGHRLFHTPNAIGDAAWTGWIQERGLYFPDSWDAAYTPLVATADPGEDIPPGALLVADYGEGTYLYTALGLYRQLRELHPGVLQLFVNMLTL